MGRDRRRRSSDAACVAHATLPYPTRADAGAGAPRRARTCCGRSRWAATSRTTTCSSTMAPSRRSSTRSRSARCPRRRRPSRKRPTRGTRRARTGPHGEPARARAGQLCLVLLSWACRRGSMRRVLCQDCRLAVIANGQIGCPPQRRRRPQHRTQALRGRPAVQGGSCMQDGAGRFMVGYGARADAGVCWWQVEEDRRPQVEAAIVRVLKARRLLDHNSIVAQARQPGPSCPHPTPSGSLRAGSRSAACRTRDCCRKRDCCTASLQIHSRSGAAMYAQGCQGA